MAGRSDHAQRRRATRAARQTGCFIYIPAETLSAAGYEPGGKLPYYRVWGSSKGGLHVRLYRER